MFPSGTKISHISVMIHIYCDFVFPYIFIFSSTKSTIVEVSRQFCTSVYQFAVFCSASCNDFPLFKGPSYCNMLKSKTSLRESGKGYIPQCEGDKGVFSPVQCSRDGESCWCVFDNGEEVPGTRVSGGRPACESELMLEAFCFRASSGLELDSDPNFFQYLVVFKLL